VDDDEDVRDVVARALEHEGFQVEECGDGRDALVALTREAPDVIVLDVMLPGVDGREVLSQVRRTSHVPVILLTSRGDEVDRVSGLEMGADDYLVKPFFPRELVARVRALIRRSGRDPVAPARLEYGHLVIDLDSREVLLAGEAVDLTAREFDLLAYLASSPRKTLTRDQILKEVWGSSTEWQDPATVTEHVRRIRHKIGAEADAIHTVRSVGYRFDP
jgi:DNA-binding response OmpR family regulator